MGATLEYGSAKIYQFPIGGRAALGLRRPDEVKSSLDRKSLAATESNCSGSWYHQAAIEEAKPAWDR